MASQTNLVLNNAAAVAKTFTAILPYAGKQQAAQWLLKEGVSPLAWPVVEIGMTRNANGTTRVSRRVIVPQVTNDAVAGPKLVCKCVYDDANGGYIIPNNALQTQIDDLEAYVKNLTAHATNANWVKNMDPQT